MNTPRILKRLINGPPKTNVESVLVMIRGDPPDREVLKTAIRNSDGRITIVMEPTTEQKAGWSFDATGCIRTLARGDKQIQYVEVIYGAKHAIKFSIFEKVVSMSSLTLDQFHELINMDIFKSVWGKLKEVLALKTFLIVAIIVSIIAIIVSAIAAYYGYTNHDLLTQAINRLPPLATPTPTGPAV